MIIFVFIICFYCFSKRIINKELAKKKTKRISKSTNKKTIYRHGKAYIYELPLIQEVDLLNTRIFSKILDLALYLIILILIGKISNETSYLILPIAIAGLFIVNPITEHLSGRTFGKFILGLRVLDDFGENPTLIISFSKHIFQFTAIIFSPFRIRTLFYEPNGFYHNKKTFTHTILNKDRNEIISKLNN